MLAARGPCQRENLWNWGTVCCFVDEREPYSSRIEAPPPVPVTQPSVQNFAQREGIRFAGWSGSSDWTSRSSLVLMVGSCAILNLVWVDLDEEIEYCESGWVCLYYGSVFNVFYKFKSWASMEQNRLAHWELGFGAVAASTSIFCRSSSATV